MPSIRLSDKEVGLIRDDALPEPVRSPFSVPRPSQLLATTPKFTVEPLIYSANGQTLSQRLTRGARKPKKKQDGATPHVSEYFPSQSPSKATRVGPPLGQKQWKRWTYDVIPKLVPVFLKLWYETESLRNSTGLELPTPSACACKTRMLEVAVVRMNCTFVLVKARSQLTLNQSLKTFVSEPAPANLRPSNCSPQASFRAPRNGQVWLSMWGSWNSSGFYSSTCLPIIRLFAILSRVFWPVEDTN